MEVAFPLEKKKKKPQKKLRLTTSCLEARKAKETSSTVYVGQELEREFGPLRLDYAYS